MYRLLPQSLLLLKLTSRKSREGRSLNTHIMHINKNKQQESPFFFNSSWKQEVRGKGTDFYERKKFKPQQ